MHHAIHICLISRQPVPNLTPLIDPQFKPRRVIMLVSPDMTSSANHLEQAIARYREIKVERWHIDDPWNIEQMHREITRLLDRLRNEVAQQQVVLNATGGTKPMSIAAYEVCREHNVAVFYVHPEKDHIIWLHPPEQAQHELADRIKLEVFLQAHGATIGGKAKRSVTDSQLLRLGEQLIQDIERYQRPLRDLNYLAGTAEKNLRSKAVKHSDADLDALIELFAQHGLLQRKGKALLFSNERHRFFVNGGWLEYSLFDAVRKVRKNNAHIHDIAFSIPIVRNSRGGQVPNELDVAFLHNNRLHIIECKTRRFRGEGEGSPGSEALYKLDSLRDLMGGLQARAMLASYHDIDGPLRRRAEDLNIHICAGAQLKNLYQHLQAFIGT